ncbi:hypothetical protein KWH01_07535 [Xanthomonas campestris pv. merremiae]|uniref:hypothetical protein n=1 Tax=Xanthomonas citri TaxID=346 RepID=UPI0019319B5B|nr:hypothetical protein [Xanthomonas citri]MBV6837128.1 hypothetical protein [Xanthomonas campestris pv. merremiae]MCC8568283.1 hypothetical protein [Xanthomonas citri pv. fuscans]
MPGTSSVVRFKKPVLWVISVLLCAFGISSVLVLGPYIQVASLVLISGDSSTLYDGFSARGIDGVADYAAHMRSIFTSPLAIVGLASSMATALARTRKEFVLATAFVVGIGWTIVDCLSGDATVVPLDMVINLIFNVLGGFLLATFGCVVHAHFERIRNSISRGYLSLIWMLWPSLAYLLLSASIFFAISFLVKMPMAFTSFKVDSPVQGYYSSDDLKTCYGRKSDIESPSSSTCFQSSKSEYGDETFDVMGSTSPRPDQAIEWQGQSENSNFEWARNAEESTRLELRLAQGCMSKESVSNALKFDPFYVSEAKLLSIKPGKGSTGFRSVSRSVVDNVQILDESPSLFWINPSSSGVDKVEVQRFLSRGAMRIHEGPGRHNYEFGFYPLKTDGEGLRLDPRSVGFSVDGEVVNELYIELKLASVYSEDEIKCEAIKVAREGGKYKALATSPYISLIASAVLPRKLPMPSTKGEMKLEGLKGWVSIDGWDKDNDQAYIESGKVTMLSVIGPITEIQVGDKLVDSKSNDLRASGDFQLRRQNGSMLVRGNAYFVEVNGHRLTPTRWEALDVGIRIPLMLGIPTGFYFILRLVISTLRLPNGRVWRGV